MGFDVKLTLAPNIELLFLTAVRTGIGNAGKLILAASDVLAPTEPDPRHGEHMTETGYVRVIPGVDYDSVIVGYGAFWARLQHDHLDWNHPHGGQAKFLEKAFVGGLDVALEAIATAVREAFA